MIFYISYYFAVNNFLLCFDFEKSEVSLSFFSNLADSQ